jgi:iron complex outermembrane receptor protein
MFSHRDVEEDITTDTDGFNYDVFSSSRVQDYEATQAELRLNTTIGEDIDLVTGLYILSDEYRVEQYLWIFAHSELFGGAGFTRDNPFVSWGSNEQDRFSMAGYAQADWHFAERWTLTLGGRLTYEEKDDVMGMAINNSNCPPGETPATATCNGVPFRGTDVTNVWDFDPSVRFGPVDEDWTSFSPRVGLEFQLNDDVMFFGFWQRAFKSGGFVNNAGTRPVFASPYDEEQVDNFEIGMNSDWFENRLRFNLRGFYAEYEDLQRGVIRAAPTSTGQETFTDNAAGAESFGVELSFSAVPLEGLTLNGEIGWLDIEYDDFTADLSGDGIETDNSGLDLVRAPEWDMHLGATYTYDLEAYGVVTLSVVGNYTDDMMTTTPNDVRFDRQRMVNWDAQLNWDSSDGRYTVSLWGKNLNEDIERLGGTPVGPLFSFAGVTQPRQYGITVTARFGR